MFPIHERDKRNNNRKRCRSFAAFLVLIVTLVSIAFLMPQSYAAEEDSDRAPYVVDWGLFDEETGTETSLMKSGVIEGDTSGMVFYIKFNHNVAQMDGTSNVGEQNCSLVSVVSNGGKPVASTAWVKDTQLEFQYRQCIFVTVTGTFDPSKYYHIAVAPGITAKNGFTNNSGADLYFSFPTAGTGDEPVPMEEPVGNQDDKTEDAAAENEETPTKDSKQSNASGNSAKSGDSQGSQRNNDGPVTANKPTAGNSTQMPLQKDAITELEVYQLDAGIFEKEADETAAKNQNTEDFTATDGIDARSTVAFSVLITLCILMVGAGAVCESVLFRRRLKRR